ncbi:MAG: EamA family transporter [Candidatus Saccharimonadales bacterium]
MWPVVIVAQVIVSSVMTVVTRKLSLSNKRIFFVVGFIMYAVIALMGFVYSLVFGVPIAYVPSVEAWLYIVPACVGIVTAWLLLYRTISLVGASNGVLIAMVNYLAAAALGYLVLGEAVSSTFVLGAVLILVSMYIAFTVRADTKHVAHVLLGKKIVLVVAMALAFAFGMLFEKLAIDTMGVWEYARYGWLMQFVCASVFVLVIGRKEFKHLNVATFNKALFLGLLTSVAGGLYILALSLGTLSATMLATSAKITLTSVLAYVFLRERNALGLRVLALVISIAGMWLLLR